MLEIRNRKTLQSKIKVCKSDVKIGDCTYTIDLPCSSNVMPFHGAPNCRSSCTLELERLVRDFYAASLQFEIHSSDIEILNCPSFRLYQA